MKTPQTPFKLRNLLDSPVTSLIGIAILIASVVTPIVTSHGTWLDSSIGMSIGLLLILSPDDLISFIKDKKS